MRHFAVTNFNRLTALTFNFQLLFDTAFNPAFIVRKGIVFKPCVIAFTVKIITVAYRCFISKLPRTVCFDNLACSVSVDNIQHSNK